jgi:chaperone modulatory protein CbpM
MNSETTLPPLSGIIVEEEIQLTLTDISRVCAVQTEHIIELVEEGVLVPSGQAPADWRFAGKELRRARVALRLQQDLGVNLAGAALALQLLEEAETLRARLREASDD